MYLGHRIGHGRVAVPEYRATAIADFVRPTTKKGVRAFFGTSGYYRKFIPYFGKLEKPLTMMTRKAEPDQVHWTLEGEQAFKLIRKLLSNTCALTIPNLSDDFRLHTDASGTGLGAVQSVVRSGEELPISQGNCRELIQLLLNRVGMLGGSGSHTALQSYLAGRRFELVMDHQALTGLRTSRNHNRRLTRWSLFLQDFQFTTRYRPGGQHQNADGLSRQCWPEKEASTEGTASGKREVHVADRHRQIAAADTAGSPSS